MENEILEILKGMQKNISLIQEDMSDLKEDMSGLKNEV
ncbi:hypothetical protein SAMN05428976_11536, partial [Clostridium sp. USBA 49]